MYCSSTLHFAPEQLDFGGTYGKAQEIGSFTSRENLSTNPVNSIADFYSNVPPGCFK